MSETTTPALVEQKQDSALLAAYQSEDGFKLLQRMALSLSESEIIPEIYRKKTANCMIAVEVANRMGISPLMVMQNLYIVKGKPAWAGTFTIAAINTSGKFSTPLQFEKTGEGDTRSVTAWALDKSGKRIEGTPITMAMVKGEGWLSNPKWKNMPEQMFCYRAASFFARLYCPDVLMGMHTEDELRDVTGQHDDTPITLTDEQMQKVMGAIKEGKPQEAEQVITELTIDEKQKKLIEDEVSAFYEKNPKDQQGKLL